MNDLRSLLAALLLIVGTSAFAPADDEPQPDPKPTTPAETDEKPPTDPDKPAEPATEDPKPETGEGTKPAEGEKPEEGEKPVEIDVVAEWRKLSDRKLQIAKRLREIKAEFADAKPALRTTLRSEFGALVDEYELEIGAEMARLAPDVLAKEADNAEAAAIRMSDEFDVNHFEQARELANVVLTQEDEFPYDAARAKRIAAVSSFALHDFEKASELLADVTPAPGWSRYQALEKPFLEPAAKEYVEFWKEEQALRTKEEALEGDAASPRAKFEIVDADGKPKGEVELLLFADEAPNTVASFVETVKSGGYDGTPFHRVIGNFVAQGGRLDPPVEWTIACECYRENARRHFRGSLSMAHRGLDTGSSQFFITVVPTHSLNAEADADGKPAGGHTVFGRVVKGMDVVDDLEQDDEIAKATMVHERPDTPTPVREGETKPEETTPSDDGDEKKPTESTAPPLPDDADGKKPTAPKPAPPLPDEDESKKPSEPSPE